MLMLRTLLVSGLLLGPATAQLDFHLARLGYGSPEAAMDPVRNRLVGWSHGSLAVPGRVMEWDGRFFSHPVAATAPGAGELAWDPAQRRMLFLADAPGGATQTWSWDGHTWLQHFPATSPPSFNGEAEMATDLARGRVVCFAGWGSIPVQTWEWNGVDWQQRFPAAAPSARTGFVMAWNASRGCVTLHGGSSGPAGPLADTWEWDGANWSLRSTSGPRRRAPGLAMSPTGNLVLFGGVDNNIGPALSETWEWDGAVWVRRFPAHIPSGAVYPRMAFDAVRGVTLMLKTAELGAGELWEWNGIDWLQRSAGYPRSDQVRSLAADPDRGRVVGFGQWNRAPLTWEWDGSQWRRFVVSGPAYREGASIAFAGNGRVMLFGGSNGQAGVTYGDTWLWDGTQWTLETPSNSPLARRDHAMAHDAARGEVVLFGGQTANGYANDTWVWNGVTWSQRFPATPPPARSWHAMANDAARAVVVMYGGTSTSDTWEWNGVDWRLAALGGGPPPLFQPVLFGAPDGQGVMVYGGSSARELWRWNGVAWTLVPYTSWPPRSVSCGAYDPVHGSAVLLGDGDTWLLGGPHMAEATPFGIGCLGSAGRPTLAVGRDWPFPGNAVDVSVADVAAGAHVGLALGWSADQQGALALPAELSTIGMPGCWLHTSLDALLLSVAANGTATWTVSVPFSSSLVGTVCFAQAAAIEVPANASGLLLSNALRLRVGS